MNQNIQINVQLEPFDQAHEEGKIRALSHDIGAVVSFTGFVRSEGGELISLTLEHYPAMTQTELERIAVAASERWEIDAVTIIHRHGRLIPGDPIVLVLVASCHRRSAFEAADFIMDYLKSDAPFWKKEETRSGQSSWVEAKASDAADKDRWSH